jgi:alkylated DNA repair dioxygenase AlkB
MQVLINTGSSRLWTIPSYTTDFYPALQNVFAYHEPPILVRGQQMSQRRDVAFYSDTSRGYQYSGQFMPSLPFTHAPILGWLLSEVNRSLGSNFNGILLNRYRDGEKYLSAHSDDEKGLDKERKLVVGLAYGAVRTFRIRNKASKQIVLDIPHQPCMLIAMEGNFQQEFTHEIPKQKKVGEERISLTFRHHTV